MQRKKIVIVALIFTPMLTAGENQAPCLLLPRTAPPTVARLQITAASSDTAGCDMQAYRQAVAKLSTTAEGEKMLGNSLFKIMSQCIGSTQLYRLTQLHLSAGANPLKPADSAINPLTLPHAVRCIKPGFICARLHDTALNRLASNHYPQRSQVVDDTVRALLAAGTAKQDQELALAQAADSTNHAVVTALLNAKVSPHAHVTVCIAENNLQPASPTTTTAAQLAQERAVKDTIATEQAAQKVAVICNKNPFTTLFTAPRCDAAKANWQKTFNRAAGSARIEALLSAYQPPAKAQSLVAPLISPPEQFGTYHSNR